MLTGNMVYTLGIFRPSEDFEPKFSNYCPHLMFKADGVHVYINDSLATLCHLLETVYGNCPFAFVHKNDGVEIPVNNITSQNSDISLMYNVFPLRLVQDGYTYLDRIRTDGWFFADFCFILSTAQEYMQHTFKHIEDVKILDRALKNMADITFNHTIPQPVFNRTVNMIKEKDTRRCE